MSAFRAGWYWGYTEGLVDSMNKKQLRRKVRSITNEQILQYLEKCFKQSRALSVYNMVVIVNKQQAR